MTIRKVPGTSKIVRYDDKKWFLIETLESRANIENINIGDTICDDRQALIYDGRNKSIIYFARKVYEFEGDLFLLPSEKSEELLVIFNNGDFEMSSNDIGCSLELGFLPWAMFPSGTAIETLDYEVQLFPYDLIEKVHKITPEQAIKYCSKRRIQVYSVAITQERYDTIRNTFSKKDNAGSKSQQTKAETKKQKKAIAQAAKAEEEVKKQRKEKQKKAKNRKRAEARKRAAANANK